MKLINTFDIDFLFLAFSSLFSIINPISAAPIFVSLTDGPGFDRRKSAWRTSLSAGLALAIFAVAGGAIFAFFGITVAAFQIAGGILFTLMSIQALLSDKPESVEDSPDQMDPSIVPLGIPLIAGPGAISTVMVLVGQARDTFHRVALAGAITLNIVLTLFVLLASPWIVRKMGATGQRIVAKIMGLITAVVGVQFIIDGSTTVVMQILKSAKM
jgi:multiple antibiotic resistance protein